MPTTIEQITINIPQSEIDHFKQVLELTRLPEEPIIPGAEEDTSYGTSLTQLKQLKEELMRADWRSIEKEMNKFHHFTTMIEDTKIHFVHEKSPHSDAIPLLLLHGWPSTFWEFKHVIEPLTNPPPGVQAFHVVAPSLPGIFLSSVVPKKEHSTPDVAHIFNTLMVSVLGYTSYVGQGGDFGAINLRQIQLRHAEHCKLVHFNGFPAPRPEGFGEAEEEALPEYDQKLIKNAEAFHKTQTGYMRVQTTEVASLGYALYDGLGMTSWLGSKILLGAKHAGVPGPEFEKMYHDHWIGSLLAYQYTHCAHTSVLMYKQSGLEYILDAFGKAEGGAPMGGGV